MKIDHPTAAQIPSLKQLWAQAFGDTQAFIDCFFRTAFSHKRSMCIASDEEVLAAAYWLEVEFSGKPAAYVYAVATAPAHRGKGLCRKLMDAIHSHLETWGYAGVILVPGDDALRQMYGKLGYADFGGIDTFSRTAGTCPIPVTQISAETFRTLRRQSLPADGVIQEKENLAFLEQFYSFYRGENCLFAAARTEGGLFVPEFLGNEAAIPGILTTLEAKKGVFRTAGTTPFAMYHPLRSQKTPGYFAFAFD